MPEHGTHHRPEPLKAYNRDGFRVDLAHTPPGVVDSYAFDCVCGNRGDSYATREGAANSFLYHLNEVGLALLRREVPDLDLNLLEVL